ncbi:CoA transferase [Sporomusa sp.]|uniref:CoA transferase n=1 Tax=Sporomusa sp. TaxID=2078658 RepID=UPI002CD09D95|nr:CoA transferase [Sporomusa sp.]HWR07377.1 CoA transferase [Sporomusa sp.]
MKRSDVPQFGPLSGVKVLSAGLSVAGPYAAAMMADFGADVIYVESPVVKDQFRTTDTLSFVNRERRNQRAIVLDMVNPEGKEIFKKLIKESDIFIENSKAGTWDKRGLSDEVLLEINPKLVICHVTGYGLTGDPDYLKRGSYDAIGQAFSGFMHVNGEPEPGLPAPAPAFMGDYIAAMVASWTCLAAYINAQKTGKGESIDCAQFEALLMIQAGFPTDWLSYGIERKRAGSKNPTFAACEPFKCQDGYIYVFFLSTNTMKGGLPLLGLEFGSAEFPSDKYAVWRNTPAGDKVVEKMAEFCAARTVAQAERELNDAGVVSSAIITYEMMKTHPHFVARGVITEWDGIEGKKVKGPAIAPRLKNNPGKVWRAAPHYGEDNEDVLSDLGYTPEQIKELYARKILKQDLTC